MAFTFKHGDRPLEGYTIQRGVGRGGFGEVYYAVSDGGREVALKYLRENPAIELRGVSHCMNLKSPHLVTIFDVKQNAAGDYFIIMEYVQGPSLRDLLIAEPDGLGAQKAAFFIRELAKGLGYLHERGIVHRDMKPGNIFYEDGYVKIGDYGLSKFISVSRHSAQTASIGTVHYMAPEIGSGHYHRGIDLYAVGVILYEMVLGRVPYDGATMGEVLMKHLTAQPEMDELPQPFGQVIRRALEKDPKDRYQTIDEMAEDLLGVAQIKDSLAGFNPRSLTAVAHGVREAAQTPAPSPNPPPPPSCAAGVQIGGRAAGGLVRAYAVCVPGRRAELTGPLAKRAGRVGNKIHRRIQQLDRKHGRRRPHRKAGRQLRPTLDGSGVKVSAAAVFLVVAIAAGLGVLAGVASGTPELGASAGLGVLMMSAGVIASRKAMSWLGQAGEPRWVRRAVTLGCCAPLLAIALAPAMAAMSWRHQHALFPDAPMTLLALIVAAMFVDWEKRLEHGAAGEMKGGQAFGAALCAFIFTAVFTQGGDEALMFTAAGIAGATSLAVQGVAWFVPLRGLHRREPKPEQEAPGDAGASEPAAGARADDAAEGIGRRVSGALERLRGSVLADAEGAGAANGRGDGEPEIPMAIPVEQDSMRARLASAAPLPPSRHTVTRAFWSVVAFALLAGAVVSFLSTVLMDINCDDDVQAVLTACVVCCTMLVFALRKTSLRKRPTFWQETLRPFLLALLAIGIGAPIVGLAVQPSLEPELRVAAISSIVLSAVLFLILLFVGRGRRRPPTPFLIDGSGSGNQSNVEDAPITGGVGPYKASTPDGLRVHVLAEQLNVSSEVIIRKCRAEGVDIKNHRSTLSPRLEATIREWFSEGEQTTGSEGD